MATGQRIYWSADVDPDVATYEIRKGTDLSQPLGLVNVVAHVIPGPNWNAASSRFFWDDLLGESSHVYQVTAVSTLSVAIGQTALFYAFGGAAPSVTTKVIVNHDYGGPDALRFVTESGVGIPDATIRIYKSEDYAANRLAAAQYAVQTDGDGRWLRPAYLEAGFDYVLLFENPGLYASRPTYITC